MNSVAATSSDVALHVTRMLSDVSATVPLACAQDKARCVDRGRALGACFLRQADGPRLMGRVFCHNTVRVSVGAGISRTEGFIAFSSAPAQRVPPRYRQCAALSGSQPCYPSGWLRR